MGVATSPGIRVMAAEAAVEAAVSSMTVVRFSSRAAMVPACSSGDAAYLDTTNMENRATASGTITLMIFLDRSFSMVHSPKSRNYPSSRTPWAFSAARTRWKASSSGQDTVCRWMPSVSRDRGAADSFRHRATN